MKGNTGFRRILLAAGYSANGLRASVFLEASFCQALDLVPAFAGAAAAAVDFLGYGAGQPGRAVPFGQALATAPHPGNRRTAGDRVGDIFPLAVKRADSHPNLLFNVQDW